MRTYIKVTRNWIETLPVINGQKIVPAGSYSAFGWSKYSNLTFAPGAKFGNWLTFGNKIIFGDGTKFGRGTKFGPRTKFGKNISIMNIITDSIYVLSNIGGAGRQILITKDNKTGLIKIEVGCFCGTVKEFIKSEKENGNDTGLISAFCGAIR